LICQSIRVPVRHDTIDHNGYYVQGTWYQVLIHDVRTIDPTGSTRYILPGTVEMRTEYQQ